MQRTHTDLKHGPAGWVVVALATLAIATAWTGLTPRPAYAQVPDSGAQREKMIVELKAMNAKLDAAVKLLTELRDQGKSKKDAEPAGG